LYGKKVSSKKIISEGFKFEYTTLESFLNQHY
ncbi:MAG: hypothetical protein C0595_07600, partial [Marinilabiliales bacterium]